MNDVSYYCAKIVDQGASCGQIPDLLARIAELEADLKKPRPEDRIAIARLEADLDEARRQRDRLARLVREADENEDGHAIAPAVAYIESWGAGK